MRLPVELEALRNTGGGFRIRLLSQPHEIGIDYLSRNPYEPVLSYGIVNPHGPTLQTILLVRDKTSSPVSVVTARLHPFAPEFRLVGHVAPALPHQREIEGDLLHLIDRCDIQFHGCATLLFRSRVLSEDETVLVAARMFASQEDLGRRLSLLRRYPADPGTRVSVEMGHAIDDPGVNDPRPFPSTLEEAASELVFTLLDPRHMEAELLAFVYAWNGSIGQLQRISGNPPPCLSFETVKPILDTILMAQDESVETRRRRTLDS